MNRNPFIRKKPKAKRETPRRVGNGREKLYGAKKTARRREIFERSGGFCEADKYVGGDGFVGIVRCNAPITWETMEWSHRRHGPNKSDGFRMEDGIASCKECHRARHNPKPNPRKPGRKMTKTEAKTYYESDKCFCGQWKLPHTAFCLECLNVKISKQSRRDLLTLEGADWIQCVADCETQILKWRPAE